MECSTEHLERKQEAERQERFKKLLELPKELIDSETSDILFRGNDVFLNYIETEQLLKDIEEE